MFSISAEGRTFRAWISKQSIMGANAAWESDFHASFQPGSVAGYVTLLPYRDGREIVELRAQRSKGATPSFLTHFVLDDLWRARKLFREMAQAIVSENARGATRVLVCCSDEVPHDSAELRFVQGMIEASSELSIAYDFVPMPAGKALIDHEPYAAVMLLPSVAWLRTDEYHQHRNAVTFCVPETAFMRGDARSAVRLLLEALGEIDTLAPSAPPVPARAVLRGTGKVLALNVMYCDRCVRVGWRVYHDLAIVAAGKITKALLGFEDLDDLMKTLFLYGVDPAELDAIEFLVPGVVNFCSMNLPSLGDRDFCIVEKVQKLYGVPTFMDNNTNAAAMGCYLLQNEYHNVTLYRHQLGHMNGGQGTVIGGHLVSGRYGLAGEPKFYQRRFKYDRSYSEQIWTGDGLAQICHDVVLASVGIMEPDVVYLAVGVVEDLDAFRAGLERKLPKYCMPEIVGIDDYRERMYLGGAALCLERLRNGEEGASPAAS